MWKRIDTIFTLKSPLHIGYLPFKGSVISPTRYYVPGKNFWGAVTKRATEHLTDNPTSKAYKEIGKQIKENFRFSYFYLYDGKTIFTPEYQEKGLSFGNKLNKLQFEHRFIGSRTSTAIDSASGTAEDRSLHEIEFIMHKYLRDDGSIKDSQIMGCIWVKKDAELQGNKIDVNDHGIFVKKGNLIDELSLGGELNYGFGTVKLESIAKKKMPINDQPENERIVIPLENDKPILSHLTYHPEMHFVGEIELVKGRGYFNVEKENASRDASRDASTDRFYKENPGEVISSAGYCFSPGSLLRSDCKKVVLEWNGILSFFSDASSPSAL